MKADQPKQDTDGKESPVVLTLDDIDEFETPEPLQLDDDDDDFDEDMDND